MRRGFPFFHRSEILLWGSCLLAAVGCTDTPYKLSSASNFASSTLFQAALNRVSPSGTVTVNEPVGWQIVVQLDSSASDASRVSQFHVTDPSHSVDITFSLNVVGAFSTQYAAPANNVTETVQVQAEDSSGNPVGTALPVTSSPFNVIALYGSTTTGSTTGASNGSTTFSTTGTNGANGTTSSGWANGTTSSGSTSGSTSTFTCNTTQTGTAVLNLDAQGNPQGASSQVTYSTLCSSPATLLGVNSPHGTFSRPVTQGNSIVVTGTFNATGAQDVTFDFFPVNGSGSDSVTHVSTFVQANQPPPPPPPPAAFVCQVTGSNLVNINLDANGNPTGASTQATYTVGANEIFAITNISGTGGFTETSGSSTPNNTATFTGVFGAPGSYTLTVTVASGSQTTSCQVTTTVHGIAPPPQPPQPPPPSSPLVCNSWGTTEVTIPVDQNGAPIGRSTEADYEVVTDRPASPANQSSQGGFAASFGQAEGGNSFLVKGTFGAVGTYPFYLTMADNANGNLQATCPVTTVVVPVAPTKSDVYRSFKPGFTDHLLSTSPTEGPAAGYIRERTEFAVYNSPTSVCNVPLYRCRLRAHHFLSNGPNCEGQIMEGQIGWVCAGQAPGTRQLYRIRSKDWMDHLSTPDWSQVVYAVGQLHYVYEGPQGFVPGP